MYFNHKLLNIMSNHHSDMNVGCAAWSLNGFWNGFWLWILYPNWSYHWKRKIYSHNIADYKILSRTWNTKYFNKIKSGSCLIGMCGKKTLHFLYVFFDCFVCQVIACFVKIENVAPHFVSQNNGVSNGYFPSRWNTTWSIHSVQVMGFARSAVPPAPI